MIRTAINSELARRAALATPKTPSNPNQLAKAIGVHSQSVYRMLADERPSFLTAHADAMLEALDLRIVRGVRRG